MKKIIFLVLVIISFFQESNAQIQKIFPDSTGAWRIVDNGRYFLMNHDTLIDGNEHHFLYEGFPDIYDTTLANKFGVYRVDSLKVYFRNFINNSLSNEEFLLYDFGLSIGDTFQLSHCYTGGCDTTDGQKNLMTLESIDSVLISGVWLKRWNFDNFCCPFVNPYGLKWYEGIGSDVGFFHYDEMICCDLQLGCFHENGNDYIFELGSALSCYAVGINEKKYINTFKIYPNPSNGLFNIEMENYQNSVYEILDLNGKIIFSSKIISEITEINLTGKTGVFILRIINENGVSIEKIILAD